MTQNFFVQDLLGTALAVAAFPLVLVIPGYLIGWALDILHFRSQGRLARLLIGLLLSNALVPILAFLGMRYFGIPAVLAAIGLCAIAVLVILLLDIRRQGRLLVRSLLHFSKPEKIALVIGSAWIVFSVLLLLDLQFGSRLYFATTSYDYTTRIAVINAISRTGVPPINPGYFPGHAEKLTYLYYYWYVAESLVDLIGGNLVNSRHAMIAGVTWTGLCLMAAIALYVRARNRGTGRRGWHLAVIGIGLLAISGVDAIPVLTIALSSRLAAGNMIFNGMIEGWNMPVMSWLNAITWVPNHVAAATQCITALLLVISTLGDGPRQQCASAVLAGLAFASAFGSSMWVMLVFAIAWSVWALALLLSRHSRAQVWAMVVAGLVGAAASAPFIGDLLDSSPSTGGTVVLPIAFYIRPFILADLLLPPRLLPIGNLLLLPVNYAMELGFFFFAGLIWLQRRGPTADTEQHFVHAEAIILGTVTTIMSFVYSNIIVINDLGIRGWLPGQFVLLVWATDLLADWLGDLPARPRLIYAALKQYPRVGRALQALLVIGLLTTALEAFATRMWPMLVDWNIAGYPNGLSPDTNLGSRTFDARLAYEFVNRLPASAVAEVNPNIMLDRPSGLYGTVQIAVSDRTAYGVPKPDLDERMKGISAIFTQDTSWSSIDFACRRYSINVLILDDVDPIWSRLPSLSAERAPLYKNNSYAVFECGSGLVLPPG